MLLGAASFFLFLIIYIVFNYNKKQESIEKQEFIKATWIDRDSSGGGLCIDKINIRTLPGKKSSVIIKQSCTSEVWVIPQSESTVVNSDKSLANWVKIKTIYNGGAVYGWVNKKYLRY